MMLDYIVSQKDIFCQLRRERRLGKFKTRFGGLTYYEE